jgi:hypothetical protein
MQEDMFYSEEFIRIPMSLKFDLDDMYYDFIEPVRRDKSLSKIIVKILRAYYEDDEVRCLIDSHDAGMEVLKMLNDQIDKIAMEHSRVIAHTNALKFETESIREEINGNSTEIVPTSASEPANPNDKVMKQLLGVVQELNNRVARLEGGTPEPLQFDFDMPDFDSEIRANMYSEINIPEPEPVQVKRKTFRLKTKPKLTKSLNKKFEPAKSEPFESSEHLESFEPEFMQEEPVNPEPIKPEPEFKQERPVRRKTEPVKSEPEPEFKQEGLVRRKTEPEKFKKESIISPEPEIDNMDIFTDDLPEYEEPPVFDDIDEEVSEAPKVPAAFAKFAASLTKTSSGG